jgi:hypothetical protein
MVDSQKTIIAVLGVALALSVLAAIYLCCRLRQAKSTNLQGLQQYQGLN